MRKEVLRYDFIEAESASPPALQAMPGGVYRLKARINSIGVYQYGDMRELRSPEEVAKSVDSFKNKPLKLGHAPEGGKVIGYTGDDLTFDGLHTIGTIFIESPEGKAAYDSGCRSMSCEYTCSIIEDAAGVFLGSPYDSRQVDIKGLAVALVDSPRGGETLTTMDRKDSLPTRAGYLEKTASGRLIYRKV